ncbi:MULTISPECIES: GntR family transcriptional regulator [Streptomyces]|uniref:GntR family transcriptional regulator protein n=2 Tax=Streptomyces TaxID=1883 RepID=A0A1R1SC31_9ACTN|nr:GntR family transcriptional regulator [Streptomyces sparsogenes]OMI35894.1 GntR family transcriptional regulator protein [Streptomyces sparsogenes DSM 40356]
MDPERPLTEDPTTHLRTVGKREILRDRVGNALRAAIISGELTPGTVYSAPTLAAKFGVSSTPVREAMIDLVREGLVVAQPNKGFLITEVSEKDLDEVTAVRLLVEPPSVRAVVPLVPAEDFPALRKLAQRIVVAAEQGDLIGYVEADRVFHLALLAHSGNRRLLEVVSNLRAQTRLLGLAPLVKNGTLVDSAAEHHQLLDFVEARNAEAAELFMHRHIGHVRGIWAGGS